MKTSTWLASIDFKREESFNDKVSAIKSEKALSNEACVKAQEVHKWIDDEYFLIEAFVAS